MNKLNKLILAILATAFTANISIAQLVAETNGIFADASGRTPDMFDKDAANKSNRSPGCAAASPAFLVKDDDRASVEFRVITRDDGTKQWAMNEEPLCFHASDVQAGEDIPGRN